MTSTARRGSAASSVLSKSSSMSSASKAGTLDEVKKQSFWDPVDVAEVLYTDHDKWAAAFRIQGLYRGMRAREQLHAGMRQLYDKCWDPGSLSFYYVNCATGESSWHKPRNLGRADIVSALEIDSAHRIRGLHLRRKARDVVQELYQRRWAKKLDRDSGEHYYVDGQTGESVWNKPSLLGARDIATPRTTSLLRAQAKERRKKAKAKAKAKAARLDLWKRQHAVVLEEREVANHKRRVAAIAELTKVVTHGTEIAKMTKDLNLAWMPLPRVPPVVFSNDPQLRSLRSLRMVGDDLVVLPMEIGLLSSLTVVNVSCNRLRALPDELCQLSQLTELNAMKNRLERMPEAIGQLRRLLSCKLACNRLRRLPDSFGELTALPKLNLELNRLRALPDTLGTLGCAVLNLNKNRLRALPACIGSMRRLESLHANFNELAALPPEIGDCPRLRELCLCNNRLTHLPERLGDLEDSLRLLWLDWNRIAGLPWTFGKLRLLESFKIEGNPNLCYPPLYLILEGIPRTLKWCRDRVDSDVISRRRRLIANLQACFAVLAKFDLANPAHFQADVPHGAMYDRYFAFTSLDCIFDEFLPALREHWASGHVDENDINEYPYSREQTLEALSLHVDANSAVCEFDVPCIRFRRCDCRVRRAPEDGGGWERRVCVPPRLGYQCERSALLLKDHIVRDAERAEQLMKRREAEAIAAACAIARRDAETWARSQHAADFFKQHAIEKASQFAADERFDKFEEHVRRKAERQREAIIKNFEFKRTAAQRKRDRAFTVMDSKHSELKVLARREGVPYWEKEHAEEQMSDLQNAMEDLEDELEERRAQIDEEEEAALERWEERQARVKFKEENATVSGMRQKLLPSQAARVKEFIATAKADYIEEQVEAARADVEQEYGVMRRVAASWRGMDQKIVFDGWRAWTRVEIEKRHQVAKRARKRKELEHAGMVALAEMASYEVTLFDRNYDEWNERTFWIHRESQEVVEEEPTMHTFLPDGFDLPVPPLTPRDQDAALARWNEKKKNLDMAPEEVRNALTTHTEARSARLTKAAALQKPGAAKAAASLLGKLKK
eukprot:g6988.t1